jgi:hypothetical protein
VNLSETKNAALRPRDVLALLSESSTSALAVRHHRLAYFIMVHSGFDNVAALLGALADQYTTILIHVDAKSLDLKKKLQKHISKMRTLKSEFSRIHVMTQSFSGMWGHSSLVMAELAGYFELLQLSSDWEYVVNLSGYDYPIRNNDVVYDDLKNNFDAMNLIEHWSSSDGK